MTMNKPTTIEKEKLYTGEIGEMWVVPYAMVKKGDKYYCAWCNKLNPTIEHLETHKNE